jgi:hypothetical protein
VSGEGQGRDRVGAAAAHNSSSSLPVQGGGAAYARASALEIGGEPVNRHARRVCLRAAAPRDGERAGAGHAVCARRRPTGETFVGQGHRRPGLGDGGDFRWARASSPGIRGDDRALAR